MIESLSRLRPRILRTALLAGFLLAGGIPLCSQTEISSADLKGTVFDPTKAVIPGATVTATNVSTKLGGTVQDATGAFIPGVTITATNTRNGHRHDGHFRHARATANEARAEEILASLDSLLGDEVQEQRWRASLLKAEAAELKKRAKELRNLDGGGTVEIGPDGYKVPQDRHQSCDGVNRRRIIDHC